MDLRGRLSASPTCRVTHSIGSIDMRPRFGGRRARFYSRCAVSNAASRGRFGLNPSAGETTPANFDLLFWLAFRLAQAAPAIDNVEEGTKDEDGKEVFEAIAARLIIVEFAIEVEMTRVANI